MKMYLAGKIGRNDWRHDVVPDLHNAKPTSLSVAGEGFTYVGPFFANFGHGMSHGPNQHGAMTSDTELVTLTRAEVAERCYGAIEDCDVFFAWVDDLTAFGTLVELGFAFAKRKKIVLASSQMPAMPSCQCGHCQWNEQSCGEGHLADLWFAVLTAGKPVVAPTPQEAVRHYIDSVRPKPDLAGLCESPIEKAFWAEHKRLALPALADLTPQVPVFGGRYRLDFGLPAQKVAIELDGYTYHSSKEAFVKDRARQRELEGDGWRVIRFAGKEIVDNVTACVRQAAQLAAR